MEWHCRICKHRWEDGSGPQVQFEPCPNCGSDLAIWPSGAMETGEVIARARTVTKGGQVIEGKRWTAPNGRIIQSLEERG